MKNIQFNITLRSCLTLTIFVLFNMIVFTTTAGAQGIKNIVIVHGAFADGSGWKSVYNILTGKGFHVSVVQNPLTSLQADIDAANRIIDRQEGPVILVGHSWGGTVITEAGLNPKVIALMYVAAYQPDKGENTLKWAKSLPSAPESGIGGPDDRRKRNYLLR